MDQQTVLESAWQTYKWSENRASKGNTAALALTILQERHL
jgi:hypothetical protein